MSKVRTLMRNPLVGALLSLAALSSASASPSLSTCGNMEVAHSSERGLSYTLKCLAGDWKLNYAGVVPSGTEPVTVPYRLDIQGPKANAVSLYREVMLAAPAKLTSSLLREAVLLDDGNLALRECKELNCTKYKPFGSDGVPVKALSETLTQEKLVVELETLATKEALSKCTTQLTTTQEQQTRKLNDNCAKLKLDVERLSVEAAMAKVEVDKLKAELARSKNEVEKSKTELRAYQSLSKTGQDPVTEDKKKPSSKPSASPVAANSAPSVAVTADIDSLLSDFRLTGTEERCNLLSGKTDRNSCRAEIRENRADVIRELRKALTTSK